MTLNGVAWQQALALRNDPVLLFALRAAPLPEGIDELIRLASGTGPEADTAGGYLKAVCLYAGSPPWRCLGLPIGADQVLAKEHYRLLIRWLHPDRNSDACVLAERVNTAWQVLKCGTFPLAQPSYPIAPSVPGRSRFPLFLAGLLAVALGLLALSLWPESAVYPDMAMPVGSPNQLAPVAVNAPVLPDRSLLALVAKNVAATRVKPESLPAPEPMLADRLLLTPAIESDELSPVAFASMPIDASVIAVPSTLMVSDAAQVPMADSAFTPSPVYGYALLHEFEQHYQDGNIDALMTLFSAQVNGGVDNRLDIRRDYQRLFLGTHSRTIKFSQPYWRIEDDSFGVQVEYLAKIDAIDRNKTMFRSGAMALKLEFEGGRLRIVQYSIRE